MARFWVVVLSCGWFLWPCAAFAGSVQHDATNQTWTLVSGPIIYRLIEKNGELFLNYFGPVSQLPPGGSAADALLRPESSGEAEGESLAPDSLQLVSERPRTIGPDVEELTITMRHERLPLEIQARYTTWGDTGVFTREVTLKNTGDSVITVASAPSLTWKLPAGDYTLRYLHGSWGEEHQLASEKLVAGSARFLDRLAAESSNGFGTLVVCAQ